MPLASLTTAPPPVSVPVPTTASDTEAPATPLPNASATFICTAGAIATPATTPLGWNGNARDAAVSCLLPVRLMLRPANLAMPLASLTTEPPPLSVPVPTTARDTEAPGTPLPNASATLICTAGAIVTPARTLLGWNVNASDAAVA